MPQTCRELNLFYTVLAKNGQGGFAKQGYWSSSQYYYGSAWKQNFGNGYQSYDNLYFSRHYIRAVRAF